MMASDTLMQHVFGIEGLTVGGAGVWALVLMGIIAGIRQWILGIADRKRAENEGVAIKESAEEKARGQLFDQMIKTTDRLQEEVTVLRARVAELEKIEREHLKEINKHLTEIALLRGIPNG